MRRQREPTKRPPNILDKASELEGAKNEVFYSRAKLLVAEGKKDNAISFVRAFIDKNPADVQALALWFALAMEKGNAEDVIKHIQQQFNAKKNKSEFKAFTCKNVFA